MAYSGTFSAGVGMPMPGASSSSSTPPAARLGYSTGRSAVLVDGACGRVSTGSLRQRGCGVQPICCGIAATGQEDRTRHGPQISRSLGKYAPASARGSQCQMHWWSARPAGFIAEGSGLVPGRPEGCEGTTGDPQRGPSRHGRPSWGHRQLRR